MVNIVNDLVLFRKENFNGVECDFWKDSSKEVWMSREQIGKALEYGNPSDAIKNIHSRNKERLDKFSVQLKMSGTDGKLYDTYLYSAKGVYEVCRFSKQPKANDFYDWVYELLEGLRQGSIKLAYDIPQTYSEALQLASNLSKQLEEQKPKVEIYDQLINQKDLLNFKQVANSFGYGRNTLFDILRKEHILSDNGFNWNLPYARYRKYFEVKIIPRRTSNGVEQICTPLFKTNAIPFIKKVLKKNSSEECVV